MKNILFFLAFALFATNIWAQCPTLSSFGTPDILDLDGPDDATISECGEVDIIERAFVVWRTEVTSDDYPEEINYTDAHSGNAPNLGPQGDLCAIDPLCLPGDGVPITGGFNYNFRAGGTYTFTLEDAYGDGSGCGSTPNPFFVFDIPGVANIPLPLPAAWDNGCANVGVGPLTYTITFHNSVTLSSDIDGVLDTGTDRADADVTYLGTLSAPNPVTVHTITFDYEITSIDLTGPEGFTQSIPLVGCTIQTVNTVTVLQAPVITSVVDDEANNIICSGGSIGYTGSGTALSNADGIYYDIDWFVDGDYGATINADPSAVYNPSLVTNSTCAPESHDVTAAVYCWNTGTYLSFLDGTPYTVNPSASALSVVPTPGGCGTAAMVELQCNGVTIDTRTGTAPDGLPCVGPPASGTESSPLAAGSWTATDVEGFLGVTATDGCYSDLSYVAVPADCPFEACSSCPTPTGAPDITESICSAGCAPAGGVIAVGTLVCTSGSLEYSVDGGSTWVASLPSYDQTTSVSFIARCNCGATQGTATSAFTTTPGTCTNPTFTGTASCSGGPGTGSISQAATGGSGSGYTYSITGGSFGPTLANGNYNVTVTDSNGCVGTAVVNVNCVSGCAASTNMQWNP